MAREEKIKCTCCCEDKRPRDFYKSASELNKATGKMSICKDCLADRFNKLLNYYEGDIKSALRHLLMNIDAYYSDEIFIECSKKDDINFLGEYFRLLARKDTRDKTSSNNLIDSTEENKKIIIDHEFIDNDIIEFWGEGYDSKEYVKLEKKYKKYTDHYPSETLQEQEIIRQLCELEVMKDKCRLSGDKNGYDKISTQIRKTMDDLNILPSKMQKYGEDKNITIGKLIEVIEKEEPIPDIHPEFEDIDKFKWMLDRYFINPFKKVFGLDSNLSYEDVENETYDKK